MTEWLISPEINDISIYHYDIICWFGVLIHYRRNKAYLETLVFDFLICWKWLGTNHKLSRVVVWTKDQYWPKLKIQNRMWRYRDVSMYNTSLQITTSRVSIITLHHTSSIPTPNSTANTHILKFCADKIPRIRKKWYDLKLKTYNLFRYQYGFVYLTDKLTTIVVQCFFNIFIWKFAKVFFYMKREEDYVAPSFPVIYWFWWCTSILTLCCVLRNEVMYCSLQKGIHRAQYKMARIVFYPRPVLAIGYCRCLRLSVRPSVRHQVCPRDNSSPVQATVTKFGP